MEKENLIINNLNALKQDINFIKEYIINLTLTQDDINSLNEGEEDLKKGRTKRL